MWKKKLPMAQRQFPVGYEKIRRKIGSMSSRELLANLDQYSNEYLQHLKLLYGGGNRLMYVQEMKRDLIHILAIVDELEEAYSARMIL